MAGRAVIANIATQGVSVVTGLQNGFNWRGVAASGVGVAAGSLVGESLGLPADAAARAKLDFGERLLKGTASAFAAGGTTAVSRGGRMDVQRIATDAFGNALASSITARIAESSPAKSGQQNAAINPESDRDPDNFVSLGDEDPQASGPNPENTRDRSKYALKQKPSNVDSNRANVNLLAATCDTKLTCDALSDQLANTADSLEKNAKDEVSKGNAALAKELMQMASHDRLASGFAWGKYHSANATSSVAESQDLLTRLGKANVRAFSDRDIAQFLVETFSDFRKTQSVAAMTVSDGDTIRLPTSIDDGTQYAWSSKDVKLMGWENVHGRAVRENLDGVIPRNAIEFIVAANVSVDDDAYQNGRNSFLHGMFGMTADGKPYFTQQQTQDLTDAWIKYNYQKAQDIIANNGDLSRALLHFGFAAHTLQDTTSPMHNFLNAQERHVFLPWHDAEGYDQVLPHIMGEANSPGASSNVSRATRGLFDVFFLKAPMPAGSIFNHWGVDPMRLPMPVKTLFG